MNEKDQALLNDMLDLSRRIQGRIKEKRFEDLATDDFALGDLILRPLEVVGEAANHVSIELKSQYPEIARAEIIGMRNRVIRDFVRVNWDIVWKTATESIPIRVQQLELILSEES